MAEATGQAEADVAVAANDAMDAMVWEGRVAQYLEQGCISLDDDNFDLSTDAGANTLRSLERDSRRLRDSTGVGG